MKPTLIFWPIFVQIALTLSMYLRLMAVKKKEIAAGNVDLEATRLDDKAWPPSVQKVNNNIRNQFEVPILFYVLCIVLLSLRAVDTAAILLAFGFAAFRLAHAIVHTTSNIVKYRMPLFAAGTVCVLGLLILAVKAVVQL